MTVSIPSEIRSVSMKGVDYIGKLLTGLNPFGNQVSFDLGF